MKTKIRPVSYLLMIGAVLFLNLNRAFSQQSVSSNLNVEMGVSDQLQYDPKQDLDEQIKETYQLVDSLLRVIDKNVMTKILEATTMTINGNEGKLLDILSQEEIQSIKKAEASLNIPSAKTGLLAIHNELTALRKEKNFAEREKRYVAVLDRFQRTEIFNLMTNVFTPILTKYLMEAMESAISIAHIGNSSVKSETPMLTSENSFEESAPKEQPREVRSMISHHEFKESNLPCGSLSGLKLLSIQCTKSETLVTFAFPVINTNWLHIGDSYALIDDETGDQYMIRGGVPLNVDIDLVPYNRKAIEFTLTYPPLKKGVKMISIKSVDNLNQDSPFYIHHVPVKEYLNRKLPQVITQYNEDYHERGFKVNPYYPYNPSESFRLISVDRSKTMTRVTIGVSIHSDVQYHSFSRNLFIIDRKTDDVYRNYLLEGGYEFGKNYEIRGHKGQVVEFTLLFPPLKRGVKEVDICGVRNDPSVNTLNFTKVNLKDYVPSNDKKSIWVAPAAVVASPAQKPHSFNVPVAVSPQIVKRTAMDDRFDQLIIDIYETTSALKKKELAREAAAIKGLNTDQILGLLLSEAMKGLDARKLAIDLYKECPDKENYLEVLTHFDSVEDRIEMARAIMQMNNKIRTLKGKQEELTDVEFEWYVEMISLFELEGDRLLLLSIMREVGMVTPEQVDELIALFPSTESKLKVFTMFASRCTDKEGLSEVINTLFYKQADREAALRALMF